MRRVFLAVALLLTTRVLAEEPIIVLARGKLADDKADITPAQTGFIGAVRTRGEAGEPLALIAPPDWGRTVAGASGNVRLHPTVRGGLVIHVSLKDLLPDHRYILTLNGNPRLPGNDLLPDSVPGNPREKYLDFFTATTDKQGGYEATFGIFLPGGSYEVRFYVKDTADFKIVLYHDYFPCAVD